MSISISRRHLLSTGLAAVGALLGNVAALILSRQFGQSFEQLNWFSISRASMISCMIAAFVYSGSIGTALKWFPNRRGLAAGMIAAGFGGGSGLFAISSASAGSGGSRTCHWHIAKRPCARSCRST